MTVSTDVRHDATTLTVLMGREVRDGDSIHCGAFTPIALGSAMWAMARHAPNAILLPISFSGTRVLRPFPISYGLLETMALDIGVQYPMSDVFAHVEGPAGCSYEPVNALQVDGYANLNMSVIGSFVRPKLRGPGVAGLDVLTHMMHDRLVLYVPRHSPKVLVAELDFVTAVGNDPARRAQAGASPAGGIAKVITNLCVFEPGDDARLVLTGIHDGVTVDQVRASTGFEVRVDRRLDVIKPVSADELELLDWVDPLRLCEMEFLSAADRRERLMEVWARELEFASLATAPPVTA
jgi:glutaconate CoA-transferase subunit B